MSIGPIRPTGPQGPNRPADPSTPSKATEGVPRSFNVGPTQAASLAAAQANPADRATYDRIARRIKESVAAGKTRPEVVRNLVRDEIRQAFGEKEAMNQSMIDSIGERFENDPQLKELLASLFRSSLG